MNPINKNTKFYKLEISDNLALAGALGTHRMLEKVHAAGASGIPKDHLEKITEELVAEEFEGLKDRSYRERGFALLAQSENLQNIFQSCKKNIPLLPYMNNLSESLYSGHITFSDKKANDGDYLLCHSREYVVTLYARKVWQERDGNDAIKIDPKEMGVRILKQVEFYKENPVALTEMIHILTNKQLIKEATLFGHGCLSNMLDQSPDTVTRNATLAEMFKNKYVDLFILKSNVG